MFQSRPESVDEESDKRYSNYREIHGCITETTIEFSNIFALNQPFWIFGLCSVYEFVIKH